MDFAPTLKDSKSHVGGTHGGRNGSSVMNEEDLLLDNFYLKKQRMDSESKQAPRHYHMDFGGIMMPPEPATVPKQKSDSYDQFIQSHFTQQQIQQLKQVQIQKE